MDIGIVGLPRSGKTTVFNAVTRGSAQVSDYSGQSKPNLGVAKVPDPRLITLVEILRPKRVVPAEVRYADLPAPVMADAAEFAKGVAIVVGVPSVARAWRLVLLRYHSEAAGDDWSDGSWASDIRWEHLSSYVL